MGLTLTIENESRLPDGGPLSFQLQGARGADIGRESHLDWTLPDPTREISGLHCEIRYKDNAYWLYDVSVNGTYLNDGDRRMQSPHRLRSGDRLNIGRYIIAVQTDEAGGILAPQVADLPPDEEDVWSNIVGAAPPLDPLAFRPTSQSRPVNPDVLEWAVDIPNSPGSGFIARPMISEAPRPPSPPGDIPILDWDAETPEAPVLPEPPPTIPTPRRRSIWIEPGPAEAWQTDPSVDSRATPQISEAPVAFRQVSADDDRSTRRLQDKPQAQADYVRRFAKGAGLPEEVLAGADAAEFSERLGRMMLLIVDNLKQLLNARSQTKRIARSSSQTMIQALDNNPLKFTPTAAVALGTMFGPRNDSYMAAEEALQEGFDDLKTHQLKTFSAMQHALQLLVQDLDPKAIESGLAKDQGLASMLAPRKARLWDTYTDRWQTKTGGKDGGLLEVFLRHFAECYDRDTGTGSR